MLPRSGVIFHQASQDLGPASLHMTSDRTDQQHMTRAPKDSNDPITRLARVLLLSLLFAAVPPAYLTLTWDPATISPTPAVSHEPDATDHTGLHPVDN